MKSVVMIRPTMFTQVFALRPYSLYEWIQHVLLKQENWHIVSLHNAGVPFLSKVEGHHFIYKQMKDNRFTFLDPAKMNEMLLTNEIEFAIKEGSCVRIQGMEDFYFIQSKEQLDIIIDGQWLGEFYNFPDETYNQICQLLEDMENEKNAL